MAWSISLGRVQGTAIRLHVTFILFLAWIGIALYAQGGWPAAVGGITFLLALFLCVLLHEFGHILVARRFGVRTPEVVLLPIGGISRLERIPERPREALLIALAGPLVTLAIAVMLVLLLGGLPDAMQLLGEPSGQNLLAQLAYANLGLLVFNLIPAFPLDGGRVLLALLASRLGHVRATQIAATIGRAAAIMFAIVGLITGHILLVLIALLIYVAAGAESGLAQLRGILTDVPARELMITTFERLPPDATVLEAAEALIRTSQREFPIVDDSGRLRGMLTREGIIKALRDQGGQTPVAAVMVQETPLISEWSRLDDTMRLLEEGTPAVAVTDQAGRLVGFITWENLIERLLITQASERRGRGLVSPSAATLLSSAGR